MIKVRKLNDESILEEKLSINGIFIHIEEDYEVISTRGLTNKELAFYLNKYLQQRFKNSTECLMLEKTKRYSGNNIIYTCKILFGMEIFFDVIYKDKENTNIVYFGE